MRCIITWRRDWAGCKQEESAGCPEAQSLQRESLQRDDDRKLFDGMAELRCLEALA
jgi:hypothetical protein